MKTYINNTFVILLLLLSSCGISKEILLPTKYIPNNFREIFKIDSNSIGKLPVNEFFSTEAIRNLIDSALIRNIDLQLALKNIDAAELILKRAKLANLPELNLQVTANSNRPSDNSLNGLSASQFLKTRHIEDFNTNLSLSWEADIWGKISR
ncbi:MAG TPA: TolC family protein, partial [Pedobacter sp.]|nr:TolC family protein [Pedobacter sp.]